MRAFARHGAFLLIQSICCCLQLLACVVCNVVEILNLSEIACYYVLRACGVSNCLLAESQLLRAKSVAWRSELVLSMLAIVYVVESMGVDELDTRV